MWWPSWAGADAALGQQSTWDDDATGRHANSHPTVPLVSQTPQNDEYPIGTVLNHVFAGSRRLAAALNKHLSLACASCNSRRNRDPRRAITQPVPDPAQGRPRSGSAVAGEGV